jgi:hypothetical protein
MGAIEDMREKPDRAGRGKRAWGIAVAATAAAAILLSKPASRAFDLLMGADDPVAVSDFRLRSEADAHFRSRTEAEIVRALAAEDADLATSLVAVADERGLPPSGELRARVDTAQRRQDSTAHQAYQFARGFVVGEAQDGASLAGTVAGDLFVYGDVRDLIREGNKYATGAETDHLVLGLAAAGLAVTAGAYATAGGAVPLRAGITLVKDARKAGRLSEGLGSWLGRSVRDAADSQPLTQSLSPAFAAGGGSAAAFKTAFRAEKTGALFRALKDAGRIQSAAGTRAAMEAVRLAETPKELAKVARLAEAKGLRTRGVLKLFGRGALLLGSGVVGLLSWVAGFAFAVFGFFCSVKAMTERLTERWLRRAKLHRTQAAGRDGPVGIRAAEMPG